MDNVMERILVLEHFPQFREADADGLVGLRGYMNYFQDTATRYMHDLHLGNDTMPEERGICWVYSKYKLHICRKVGFTGPIQMKCWVEDQKPTVRLYQDLVIVEFRKSCFGPEPGPLRLQLHGRDLLAKVRRPVVKVPVPVPLQCFKLEVAHHRK